jgi:hypothetical protein
MNKKNDFPLKGIRYLLFDIFYKNNKLWLVLPVYDLTPLSVESISVSVEGKQLELTEKHVSTYYYGPTAIYAYDIKTPSSSVCVKVEYEWREKVFHLNHIVTSEKSEIGLTTLCKDDYMLFVPFYKYYKDQGVSQFYIYYNKKVTPEIKQFFQNYGNDVVLIEWNYIWKLNEDTHHAQIGQLNHALYKYGKENHTHMIFCDLDEYLHIPKTTLKQFVDTNKNISTFGFCNKWSRTIDNTIPDVFPRTFLTEPGKLEYPLRSKNIYKVSDLSLVFIHHPLEYVTKQDVISDLTMYHFYNWTQPERMVNVNFEQITLSDAHGSPDASSDDPASSPAFRCGTFSPDYRNSHSTHTAETPPQTMEESPPNV